MTKVGKEFYASVREGFGLGQRDIRAAFARTEGLLGVTFGEISYETTCTPDFTDKLILGTAIVKEVKDA